jgi:hypothetical protein
MTTVKLWKIHKFDGKKQTLGYGGLVQIIRQCSGYRVMNRNEKALSNLAVAFMTSNAMVQKIQMFGLVVLNMNYNTV